MREGMVRDLTPEERERFGTPTSDSLPRGRRPGRSCCVNVGTSACVCVPMTTLPSDDLAHILARLREADAKIARVEAALEASHRHGEWKTRRAIYEALAHHEGTPT